MTDQYGNHIINPPRYVVESYTCFLSGGLSESGWSVMDGDDTIHDFGAEEEAKAVADILNRMQP